MFIGITPLADRGTPTAFLKFPDSRIGNAVGISVSPFFPLLGCGLRVSPRHRKLPIS